MNILGRLKTLVPDLTDDEVDLQDDGSGVYIKAWRNGAAQPTQAAIDATPDPSIPAGAGLSEAELVAEALVVAVAAEAGLSETTLRTAYASALAALN